MRFPLALNVWALTRRGSIGTTAARGRDELSVRARWALLSLPLLVAQGQQQEQPPSPIFKVNVVAKSTKAINYRHRSGSTTIDFAGTALMPKAKGQARVDSRQGAISIVANFKDVGRPASSAVNT